MKRFQHFLLIACKQVSSIAAAAFAPVICFFKALNVLRASAIVTVLAVIILAYGDQTREVYKALAEEAGQNAFQIATAFLALIGVTFLSWYTGRRRAVMRRDAFAAQLNKLMPEEREKAERREAMLRPWLRWLPRLIAAAIPLSMAAGLYITADNAENLLLTFGAARSAEIEPIQMAAREARSTWLALVCAAALCGLIALGFVLWAYLRTRNVPDRAPVPGGWITAALLPVCILLLTVLLTISFALVPVVLAQSLGSLSIVFLFIACLLTITSSLLYIYDRFNIPVISLLALCAVIFTVAGWNTNVVNVRPLQYDAESGIRYPDRIKTHQAFDHWLATRGDSDHFDRYPVFIVAAAGGGLYAAHHAATFLARMQDLCPSFAQHVFAYSGISGGSLGVSVFAALAKDFARNGPLQRCKSALEEPGEFETMARKVLGKDYLSPLLASALFPNFFQVFFPHPLPGGDRATAFAETITHNYRSVVGEKQSGLDDNFTTFWGLQAVRDEDVGLKPADQPPCNAPTKSLVLDYVSNHGKKSLVQWDCNSPTGALVLNGTDVDHGHRVVISPFKASFIDDPAFSGITWFQKDASLPNDERITHDVSLADAITISARFPFLLDAGIISTHASMRLVDGGYFESSGVETALEIMQYLKRLERDRKIKLYLITIRSTFDLPAYDPDAPAFEIAPLNALLAVREGRGQFVVGRALLERSPCLLIYTEGCENNPPAEIILNLRDFKIPLAWHLSPSTLSIVGAHAGRTRTPAEGACGGMRVTNYEAPIPRARLNIYKTNCNVERLRGVLQ